MTRRRAQSKTCRRCGATTLFGLDADRAALDATADPVPLTRAGELRAALAGRATYALASGELHHRDRWALTAPARVVVPEHRCGQPVPADWVAPMPEQPAAPDTDEPRF